MSETRSTTFRRSGSNAPLSTRPSTRRCTRARSRIRTASGPKHAKRLHWYKAPTKIKNTSFGPGDVSIKWFEDGVTQRRLQLHRPAPGHARQADRDHLGGRRSHPVQAHHLSRAARRGLQVRQYPAQPQRQEGRPRHHLPADDPRGGLRHARLRAHRRDPFGRVRRLLAGLARRPHRGLRVQRRHHRRRRRARRPQGSAEGQRRCRHRQGGRRRPRHRRAPHRRKVDMQPVRDVWLPRGRQGRDHRNARAST